VLPEVVAHLLRLGDALTRAAFPLIFGICRIVGSLVGGMARWAASSASSARDCGHDADADHDVG
jgi:hypothetical protein